MVSISTIVDDVLDTHILTWAQRSQISSLLNSRQCTDEDMTAILQLVDALSNNFVIAAMPN